MALQIASFPEAVLENLIYILEPNDLFQLALSSKQLYQLLMTNDVWRLKSLHDFGDLFQIYTLFTTVAGFDLDSGLAAKYGKEPTDWKQYYLSKNKSATSVEKSTAERAAAATEENADTQLIEQADQEYISARTQLESFQENGNVDILMQVASKMMWILDTFPTHAGCYYILGFILFVLNKLEEARILLQMGCGVDPDFEPFHDLEAEIERIQNGYQGDEELLDKENSNQLSRALLVVLEEIFNKFDKDHDGALNTQELDSFIFTTNGTHPPPQFLRQMGLRFGANKRGWLTKEGFFAFYLEQTLDDPSETRNDLGVHGYDPQSLRKNMEE